MAKQVHPCGIFHAVSESFFMKICTRVPYLVAEVPRFVLFLFIFYSLVFWGRNVMQALVRAPAPHETGERQQNLKRRNSGDLRNQVKNTCLNFHGQT